MPYSTFKNEKIYKVLSAVMKYFVGQIKRMVF